MWTRPRETAELFPISVTGPVGPVLDFEVAVVPEDSVRPVDGFVPAAVEGTRCGVFVTGLAPGDYWVFVRYGTRVFNPLTIRIT